MDNLQTIALMMATLTMGLAAGVYLLYMFAIMPGLGRTDDRTFVGSFQQIDTSIVGPFLLVFFLGPFVFAVLAIVVHLGDDNRSALTWIAIGLVLHLVVAAVTIGVHVPLNDAIKAAGDPSQIDNVAEVRDRFNEARWIQWNAVRSLAATSAFACLAWALTLS